MYILQRYMTCYLLYAGQRNWIPNLIAGKIEIGLFISDEESYKWYVNIFYKVHV